MSDDTIRLVTLGRIVRHRGRLLLLLALAGALAGYGASLLFPPRYTTSVSVLLPGAWEERELLTQAQVATSSVVLDRTAGALGWDGTDGEELKDWVTAEIADGNIIRITGTADSPEKAQRLSDRTAREFIAFTTRILGNGADPEATTRLDALRQTVERTSRRVTELADAADPGRTVESVQARTELEKLRTALHDAVTKLDQADPAADRAGRTSMVVMGAAARPTGEAPPTRIQLVAAGALLFFLLAVGGHLAAARVSRRLRTEPEIAAALGTALLGTVEVPADRSADRSAGSGPGAVLRRLLGTDTRWDVPAPKASGGETDRRVRYRRVSARLRNRLPVPGRLLVVVPEGDATGRRAAGLLLAETGEELTARVAEVPVGRPMVPDRDGESGALVVLGAGQWTGSELTAVAEACADAGHELVGVVVAGQVRDRAARSARRSGASAAPAPVGDDTKEGAR
ncbi:polysaccharide biosynthesis protein [Streptomyces termitum]|uniref:polysaccharide biosynthesis protein n=1 Tax=Streptomyces termitum TaxID=67368 RepID=UPI0037A0D984